MRKESNPVLDVETGAEDLASERGSGGAQSHRKRPRRHRGTMFAFNALAAVCLIGAIAVAVSSMVGSGSSLSGDQRGDQRPSGSNLFEVEVVEVEGVPGLEYTSRCDATGFTARLTNSLQSQVKVEVQVEFVSSGGDVLQQARLPQVVVGPGEPTMIDVPYASGRVSQRLRSEEPHCRPTVLSAD